MTKSEYQELVGFLGKKFDAIDRRFDGIEGRLTRVELLAEENRHQIQLVAEAVGGLADRMESRFAALRREMAEGFQIQGRLIQELGARVSGLERRPA